MKSPRALTEAAIVAKTIRTELKTAGCPVKFQVTSKNYSGGDSVRVVLEDPAPVVLKAVKALVSKFEGGSFDAMQDLYTYNANRTGPTVKYLFVDANYSPDVKQAAWDYLRGWLAGFAGAPESWEQAGGFRNPSAREYGDRLLHRVITGNLGHFWAQRKPRVALAAPRVVSPAERAEDDERTARIERIKAQVQANLEAGAENRYAGLKSSEIGEYNRHLMFGGCSAETWSDAEWSAIVD